MPLFKRVKNFLSAYAMLTGTIIGVGVFSLPYVVSRAGILITGAYFIFLSAVAILIHIFWGEVAAKTPGHHRLPGMARIYLGRTWGRIAGVTAIGSLLGAILAYVILGADFFHTLLGGYWSGGQWPHVVLYCLLGTLLVAGGNKIIAQLEVWGIGGIVLVFVLLLWRASGHWQAENILAIKDQAKNFFLPYGLVLFSLWGASAIPEVRDILGRDKKRLNQVVVSAILTAAVFYLVFIGCILGLTGPNVDPTALGGLSGVIGQAMGKILIALGMVAIFTSYITLMLALNKILVYDLKIKPAVALVAVGGVPMALYFLGINNFIGIIAFVGSVMLAIDGMFIAFIYKKMNQANKKQKLAVWLTVICLAVGLFYEIYKIL